MAQKIQLMKILYKNTESNKYEAVLSDDSIDRDDEIVSKKALTKIANNEEYTPILIDHENKALNQIGEWINKRVEKRNDHWAFVAEPKFWKSNSKAMEIKGCLDEGAKYGISIGASVNDYEETKIKDKSYKTYTDIELLEASFVGVPANKNGMAQAVTKAYNKAIKNLTGEKTMSEDMVKKADFDSKVEELEKSNESIKELEGKLEKQSTEIAKLKKELDEAKACAEEKKEEDNKEDMDKEEKSAVEELTKKMDEMAKEIKEIKEQPVFKAHGETSKELTDEEINKSVDEGKLPVMMK